MTIATDSTIPAADKTVGPEDAPPNIGSEVCWRCRKRELCNRDSDCCLALTNWTKGGKTKRRLSETFFKAPIIWNHAWNTEINVILLKSSIANDRCKFPNLKKISKGLHDKAPHIFMRKMVTQRNVVLLKKHSDNEKKKNNQKRVMQKAKWFAHFHRWQQRSSKRANPHE